MMASMFLALIFILLGSILAEEVPQDAAAASASAQKAASAANNSLAAPEISSTYLLALAAPHGRAQFDGSALDEKLSAILERDGPDMRSSRENKDFDDISLEVALRGWQLLRDRSQRIVQGQLDLIQPTIERVLIEANSSAECLNSTRHLFEGAKRMESWAIKLLNSWSNFPPVGLFEGTYTELGSYETCVGVPENVYIGHAHYCTISYRPVMPSHRKYHLIVEKESQALLQLFQRQRTGNSSAIPAAGAQRDSFTDILENSHYFHYLYLRLASCWPIKCSPFDVRRVAKYIGRKNILLSGPIKCYSRHENDYIERGSLTPNGTARELILADADVNQGLFIWKPYFSTAQLVAGAILVHTIYSVLLITLIDIVLNRLAPMQRHLAKLLFSNSHKANNIELDNRIGSVGGSSKCMYAAVECNEVDNPTRLDPALIANQQTKQNQQPPASKFNSDVVSSSELASQEEKQPPAKKQVGCLMSFVKDTSIVTNLEEFFSVKRSQSKYDISCLHGIRCITMTWIIIAHTMMYNDWASFGRTKEIEKSLRSLVAQPLFNGSYLIDVFFLMSGLLTAFGVFKNGAPEEFRLFNFVFSRWLRLTPQILLVSLIYIVLPLLNDGPFWAQQVGEYSQNCSRNWWINLLHIQAFFETKTMCNFVTWWVSMDSWYHFYAILIIGLHLNAGRKAANLFTLALLLVHLAMQAVRHFTLALPPNILSTIPQTGSMWSEMTLGYFWKPYAHTIPYLLGFVLGRFLASRKEASERLLNPRRALIGWSLVACLLVLNLYGTHFWVIGEWQYSRLESTVYHITAQTVWALCFAWIIVACQLGYGGPLGRFLSSPVFFVLGKASYIIYLSHFQVVFSVYGSHNLLLEPSQLVMSYLLLGNIVFSTLYGILLCIVLEMPLLKLHKRVMRLL